jgi:geranylgeranyl pyrophosphate synthase
MNQALKSKERLVEYAKIVGGVLNNYFELNRSANDQSPIFIDVYNHIAEHCLRGGKRLRGSLVVAGYELFNGKDIEEITKVSIASEIAHTALLIHDDVIDQDSVRRGGVTTHQFFAQKSNQKDQAKEHFGESVAICAGDIALLTAPQIILDSRFAAELKVKAAGYFLRGLVTTGYGEILDVAMEDTKIANEDEIKNLHHLKTGVYTYLTPLGVGATLAGATSEQIEKFNTYCSLSGISFQIQDDILGLFGDEQKTGKSNSSDIKEGKITLLYLKALESQAHSKRISELWGKKDINSDELEEVKRIITETGSLNYSIELSKSLAMKAANSLPKGEYNQSAMEYLEGLAQYLVEREI